VNKAGNDSITSNEVALITYCVFSVKRMSQLSYSFAHDSCATVQVSPVPASYILFALTTSILSYSEQ
jgi:hypothetical protein